MLYRDAVLADSPQLYWECQELNPSLTTVGDSTSNGRVGTRFEAQVGQAPAAHSQVYSYYFDGINDRCYYSNNTLFNVPNFAFEIVFNLLALPPAGKRGTILTIANGLDNSTHDKSFYITDTGHFEVYGYDGATKRSAVTGLASFGMHHVVGRHLSGGNLELWVDGVLATSIPCGPTFTGYSNATLIVGGQTASDALITQTYANIRASDVAWYTTLSDERIVIHAQKALAPNVLAGTATLDDGQPASYVLIRSWDTYGHLAKVIPGSDGSWSFNVAPGNYEVTTVGPTGYQPICHGPVVAVEGD